VHLVLFAFWTLAFADVREQHVLDAEHTPPSCTANNLPGLCVTTAQCHAASGTSVANQCPHSPHNVHCCVGVQQGAAAALSWWDRLFGSSSPTTPTTSTPAASIDVAASGSCTPAPTGGGIGYPTTALTLGSTVDRHGNNRWAINACGKQITWRKDGRSSVPGGAKIDDLMTAADFATEGMGASAHKIYKAVTSRESDEMFGCLNLWDSQLVTFGASQFACTGGSLIGLFCRWKQWYPTEFHAFLGQYGIDCPPDASKTARWTWYITVNGDKAGCELKNHGRDCDTIKTGCHTLQAMNNVMGSLQLAGFNKNVARLQLREFRDAFWSPVVNLVVGTDAGQHIKLSQVVTSEYTMGVIIRVTTWKPGWVKGKLKEYVREHGTGPYNVVQNEAMATWLRGEVTVTFNDFDTRLDHGVNSLRL